MQTDNNRSGEVEALLHEEAWLRRLVRGLVLDHGAAEDLAQDVLAEALGSQPARALEGGRLRAWLATTARRMAGRRGQRDRLRVAVESLAASERAGPQPDDLALQRLHVSKRMAEALETLDTPYRTAIVMRYFDDLPPREIAKRLGVPSTTARQRVSRGVAMLRDRLDRDFGSRDEWLQVMVPFVPAGLIPTPTTGQAPGKASLEASLGAAGAKSASIPGLPVVTAAIVAAALFAGALITWNDEDASPRVSGVNPSVAALSSDAPGERNGNTSPLASAAATASERVEVAPLPGPDRGEPSGAQSVRVRFDSANAMPLVNLRAAWVRETGQVVLLDVNSDSTTQLPGDAAVGTLIARADGFGTEHLPFTESGPHLSSLELALRPEAELRGKLTVNGSVPSAPVPVRVTSKVDFLGLAFEDEVQRKGFAALAEAALLPVDRYGTAGRDGLFTIKGIQPGSRGSLSLPRSFARKAEEGTRQSESSYVLFDRPETPLIVDVERRRYVFGRAIWDDTASRVCQCPPSSPRESRRERSYHRAH